MFVKYFHLEDQPFGATPDPRFLYQTASHREALASLYCAFHSNRGFTALIAGPGMGKTTLLYEFLGRIHHRSRTVFLFNTLCEPGELIAYLLEDLGLRPGANEAENHRRLNEFLAAEAREDRRVVLVVDEAQNLSTRALETLRLLTNFETSRAKLLQIVLAGQPQLAENLNKPEVAQLAQRISTVCHLDPLSPRETYDYIEHRLKVAGHSAHRSPFTADALKLIAEESHGIPRMINTLCYNSLCLCAARRAKQVDEKMAREAKADLQLPGVRPIQAPPPAMSSLSALKLPAIGNSRVPLRLAVPLWAAAVILAACAVLFGVRLRSVGAPPSTSSPQLVVSNSPEQRSAASIKLPRPRKASVALSPTRSPGGSSPSTLAISRAKSPVSQNVTIGEGDTLERIATIHLGRFNETILQQIRELNPGITDPNHIESGRIIRLPGQAATTSSNAPGGNEQ